MLGVVVVLGCHNNLVSNKESRIETHSKLANQLGRRLPLSLHLRHLVEELAGARLGDGAQVSHQLVFGHSDTGVGDVEHVLLLIRLRTRIETDMSRV